MSLQSGIRAMSLQLDIRRLPILHHLQIQQHQIFVTAQNY